MMSQLVSHKWEDAKHTFLVFRHVHGKTACFLLKVVGVVTVVGVGVYATRKLLAARKKRHRVAKSKAKPGIVLLHQFPRGLTVPSISPFPLKLETYLRIAKIPYETDFDNYFGAKGKCPWITLNGEDIEDSQIIIEYLNSKFEINLNSSLTEEEKSIGHAFRIMAENYLYWALALYRWVYDKEHKIMKMSVWPFPLVYLLPRIVGVRKSSWHHGIGRHTQMEVANMALQDLKSISIYLGSKPFFFGSEPSEVDCALFGMLAQILWTLPDSVFERAVDGELSNLKQYCYRMKDQFWPDWNNCIRREN